MKIHKQSDRRRQARRISDVPSTNTMPGRSTDPREAWFGLRTMRGAAVASAAYASLFTLVAWSLSLLFTGDAPTLAHVLLLAAVAWLALFLPARKSIIGTGGIARGARSRTVNAVRRGIERGELELHYQPQIDLQTGAPYGVEALVRWRREDGTLSPPGEFLPAVESSDLIGPFTHRVLQMAIRQASEWKAQGHEMRMAINLSAANLRDFSVVTQLRDLIEKHDVSPSMLTLEVTETSVLEEPEQARAVLDAISDLGALISIDDFGAGYSSLLWLRIFPLDEVKIDRGFVSQLHGEGKAFVGGVVRLARDLDMKVIAEGVEETSILDGLQSLGCESGQGFLFARPMPADEVIDWIDSHNETAWARRESLMAIAPDFASIDAARAMVEERAIKAGMAESDIWDMRVAATEAISNAIEHAPLAEDGLIHLRISQEQGELLLEITGGGNAGTAPPKSDPDRGRGIGIMTALMDEVEMKHDQGGVGLIRLAKKLKQPGADTRFR